MSTATAHQLRGEGGEHSGGNRHQEPLGADQGDPLSGHVGDAWSLAVAGSPSPLPYKQEMEERFGEDFSRVRAFLGRPGPMEAIGAHAATRGEDVVFAERAPSKKLVAHELTHVVQRRRGASGGVRKSLRLSQPGDAAEREAERVGERVARGNGAAVAEAQPGLVHRSKKQKKKKNTKNRVVQVPVNGDLYDGAGSITKSGLTGFAKINRVRTAQDIDPARPGTYFFVFTSPGGWIHSSDISWKKSGEKYNHLLKLTQKVKGKPTKMKTIEGGPQKQRVVKANRPSGFEHMRVNQKPKGRNQLAADYLMRPGRGLNLAANVPDNTKGSFGPRSAISVDLLPGDTPFTVKLAQKAVHADLFKWYDNKNRLIKEGKKADKFKRSRRLNTKMKFVYGYAKLPSGRHSWGWVADSALKRP